MKRILPLMLFAAFVAAVPASMSAANASSTSAEVLRAEIILSKISLGDECVWHCDTDCAVEGDHRLDRDVWSNDTDNGGGGHFCIQFEFGCQGHTCGGGSTEDQEAYADQLHPDELEELETILQTVSAFEVAQIIANNDQVEYNEGRDAVQVIGCKDAVFLSVPQNGRLVTAID